MSEKAPLSKDMLNTLRTMALHSMPEGHGGWKLFGYIDWLEMVLDRIDDGQVLASDWRAYFDHPDA